MYIYIYIYIYIYNAFHMHNPGKFFSYKVVTENVLTFSFERNAVLCSFRES